MNEVWNLDPLYKGFDDPAFEADLASAKEAINQFTAHVQTLENGDPKEALRRGIELQETISTYAEKLGL